MMARVKRITGGRKKCIFPTMLALFVVKEASVIVKIFSLVISDDCNDLAGAVLECEHEVISRSSNEGKRSGD
jgi:hypothetical protein